MSQYFHYTKGVGVMKQRYVWLFIALLVLSACSPVGPGLKNGGWRYSQKSDFLKILASDKYASLCELKPVYNKYQQTKDPKLLNKLLIGYTENLANSCIDIKSFKASQRAKKASKIKTHFSIVTQSVSAGTIMSQLSAGQSIEEILSPYVPASPQFDRLLRQYHAQKSAGPTESLRKIKLNLERTKIIKPADWSTYVLINVPEYKFRLFEGGVKTMEFAVIVGKKAWQTPIFSSSMKYIVKNPTWNVPDNIAREDIIPKLIRNPGILKRKNMVVRRDYNIDSSPVNPKSVNWRKYLTEEYKHKELPYKLIQKSSSKNALGTVKFIFPNRFSVYMHDTQAKGLFSRQNRAYSHGCIRLQQPKRLLEHVMNNYTATPYTEAKKKAGKSKMSYINLTQKIPVHIVYLTMYVDESGVLHTLNDVYGFDASQKLKGAL
jgi:hypothetical protein